MAERGLQGAKALMVRTLSRRRRWFNAAARDPRKHGTRHEECHPAALSSDELYDMQLRTAGERTQQRLPDGRGSETLILLAAPQSFSVVSK